MGGTSDEKEKCLEKLNEMQKFLPFLDFMIDKIKKKHVLPLECQLSKFQYIRSLIVEKNGRYSLEGLINIEEILQKLITKLDYKGLIPKDGKESSVVKAKSTSSKEVLAKNDNESADLPNDYVPITTNSNSNAFVSNINDSPSGRVDVLINSLRMSAGHSSQSDDTNVTNPILCSDSSAVESTKKIGIAELECADTKESANSQISTKIAGQISVEPESISKSSSASDVLAISRRKLLKSVSGKAPWTDNNKESDLKTVVCPDSSKNVESSVSGSGGDTCDPICSDKKENDSSSKNDSSKNLLPDISDEEYNNQKNRSNGKCTSSVNGGIIKKRKSSVDGHGTWDAISKAGLKYSDSFIIGSQPNYVFEFSNKQKLRERLSADIAEVHKVPGRSVGGSLRSLKDIKTSSQEYDLAKPDKTTGSHVSDVKKTSSKEKSDRRGSYGKRHSYPEKDSNSKDSKSSRKVSSRDASREKWRHGKYGSDKKKSDTSHPSSKSSSGSNGTKEKRRKGKEESEIDKLNDHELVAFVKENISSFPNLSKLKADELRRVARYSLSAEDYSSDEKSDVDVNESSEDKTLSEQDLSREKNNNNSPHYSPPPTDDGVPEVNTDSVHLPSAKDNGNPALNIEVRSDIENSKTLPEESVYSLGSLSSSTQAESVSNPHCHELQLQEDLSAVEFRDQRLKHPLPIASDTRYIVNETRISNWAQKADVNPTESSSSARFSSIYNDRNTCDSGLWNTGAGYENPYFNTPNFPVQGNDRFQKYESGSYDASSSTQKLYGTASETVRLPGYNICRNSNYSMPEPKSYREYKELKRQEQEIMNRLKLPHRDGSTSGEPTMSEEELSENKNKLSGSFFGSKSVDDGKVKDSSKSLASAKTSDYRGTKVHGPKTVTSKSNSKFRKSLEEDKEAKTDKALVSKKSSVEDELISPLEKLYDNNHKPVTGRGYGLQNFKIPKKGKTVACKDQKPQPQDQEPKTIPRPVYDNKFDTETSASRVSLEDEDRNSDKSSDHFTNIPTPSEVKNASEFHSTGNKVAYENDAGKSNSKHENIVSDFNDSSRNGRDENKNKAVISEQSSCGTEILTREESVNNHHPENIMEPESAEGFHAQLNENDVYEKCSESEVSQDISKPQKSPVPNTNLDELYKSTTDGKDRDTVIVESRNPEEKEQTYVEATYRPALTEDVTQEVIEALIKNSFESGEAELILEKAKLFKDLAFKLNSKKLKTIQKIINSESDNSSSSSDSSEVSERKRKKKKKSDSDDILEKLEKKMDQNKKTNKSTEYTDNVGNEVNKNPEKPDNVRSDKNDSLISDPEVEQVKKELRSPDKNSVTSNPNTELIEQVLTESPPQDLEMSGNSPSASCEKEPEQKAKVKVKSKGKTELDRLHEDIRSMFIASGMVNATGQRMCRLLRESGGKMNNLDLDRESAKMIEEEKLASRKTGRRSFAQTKGIRNKPVDQRTLRDRSKARKQLEVESAKFPTSETCKNMDFDNVNLSNVVKSQPRVILQRIDLEKLCYPYKIGGLSESCTRQRGLNTAKRGRSSRNSTRNAAVKKVYKPKKLSDVIQNLRARNKDKSENKTTSKHSECGGEDNEQKKENSRELLKPDAEQIPKENILRHNELLNYAFDRNKSLFFCLLCEHNTRAIAEHYVLKHPGSEVLISRLSLSEAAKAVRQSEANSCNAAASENADNLGNKNGEMKPKLPGTSNYLCRMCNQGSSPNIPQFFSHVSTHTGEYRFQCPVKGCGLPIANRENVKSHVSWKHPESRKLGDKPIELFPLPNYRGIVYGYLCSYCNYVQLLRKNVEAHIVRQHDGIEGIKIIRIDMSRERDKKTNKKRTVKKKKSIHHENEETGDKKLLTANKDNGVKARIDSGGKTLVRYEIVSRNTSQGIEESCSRSYEVLGKEIEVDGSGASGRLESEAQNIDIQVQEKDDTQSNDIIPVADENVILEGTVGMDIFDPTVLSCVGYEVDVPMNEIEQANCFDITETDEDILVQNEVVEEVILTVDSTDVQEILITDETPDSDIARSWEVGPLKAFMGDNEIVYTCTSSECGFSSIVFEDLENHIFTIHDSETWSGVCKTCNDFPESKVEDLDDVVDIRQILKHLESHIKMDSSEDVVKNMKSDEVVIYEKELMETMEHEEFHPVTIEEVIEEESCLSMKTIVRSITADSISMSKNIPDDDYSCIESQSTVSDALGDDKKDNPEPLITIKKVRSLEAGSKGDSSSDTDSAARNTTVQKIPPNAELISGKPVLVRSCPSPKITICPETNAIPIPVAQVQQDVEPRRLKVVSAPSDAESSGGKQQEVATSPIRIVSPATLPSKTVQTITTPTCVAGKSEVSDSLVISSKKKKQTLSPTVKKRPSESGLLLRDVTISTAEEGSNKKKKKSSVAPPLISIAKSPKCSPPKESSPQSKQISPKTRDVYPVSFSGKNIKDKKIYNEMLTKKKLCQLFKCMAVECSFTSNRENDFTRHIGLHEAQRRAKGKTLKTMIKKIYNWQQCAYCCEALIQTGPALTQHILAEHGPCLYQCAYCFYRAVSDVYVNAHEESVHERLLQDKKKLVYKCQPVAGISVPKQVEKQNKSHNVRPFHCEICGCKFFIIKHFFDHLTKHHQAVTAYVCHICKIVCFKADRLIAHYKLHSYSMFQCSYCLHGADTQKDMLLHLCNFHFTRPPILYARIPGDVSSGNIIFDDLKFINLENEQRDPDCIVEEIEAQEYEEGDEDIGPLPISGDLSSIVSELGINIEDGVKSNIAPPRKVIMDVDTDYSRLVPVETILPNAKFSSDSDNICEESTSIVIGSEFQTRRPSKKEKETVIPLSKLPVELLRLGTKDQSSAPKTTSTLEHLASIEEGIQKLQQNNCEVIISPVPEKKSGNEMPSRSMHKLPPTIPINRSGMSNIYQVKKNVTKKLENIPRPAKPGVPGLLKCLGTSQKISPDKTPQKKALLAHSTTDGMSTKKKKDTARIPSMQTVVGLKRQGSELELESNICDSNLAKRPRRSSGPISSLIALNSSRESPLMISNVRSLSTESTTLQPPIIRVEDFANDEKGNLVRKKEGLSIEIRKGPSDSRKGGNSINEDRNYYPNLSPDVVIINLDKSRNNSRRDYVVNSGDALEQSENISRGGRAQNKLEFEDEDNKDVEEEAEEEEEEEEEKEEEEEEEEEEEVEEEEELEEEEVEEEEEEEEEAEEEEEEEAAEAEGEMEEEEEDLEIRKEMEQLRSDIGNETESLLLEVASQGNDPLTFSETSESSKMGFSTDGETMNSFNEGSQSENVDNVETPVDPLEKNVAEEPEKVIEINKSGRNEMSSDEGKEDEQVSETQLKSANRGKNNQVQKKPKANPPKGKELTGKDLYLCGIANCNFAAENHKELKDHVCVCDYSRDSSVLSCPHCSRQFKQTMSYVDHLKIHGEKKYSCGICNFCSTTESNVNRHLKQKHKCSQTKALPNDSFKAGHFIVYPKNYKVERRNDVMNVYSPGDEDKLPLQSIYQENVKCSQCPYFTKVRSNMVRHLKIHIKSAETEGSIVVPKTAPTNPVPCLEAKERMFDKMANLAASSQLAHANKDKKDTLPPEEKAKFPQFVPEQMRYKCCSPDCNYLTVDDNMLKHHIKALHNELNIYSCPHCRESVHVEFRFTPLDKIGQHLKYHDSKLYKCCHCLYFHYQKYVVEKHLLEKHPERRFFVYTVREPNAESSEEQHQSPCDSVVKLWKCGFCEHFEKLSRSDVVEHLIKVHNMKSKFKCKYCDMKSSQYSSFVSHFASKHQGLKVECIRSIVQVNRPCSEGSQSSASQDFSNEYFDTTPLWQRDAPRVRHIRGILIEEEEVKKKKTKKVEDVENETATASTFPIDSFYCPLCADKKKLFRTRSVEMFRNHLYQELNYQQYACTLCGKMFVDKKEYERHHLRYHANKIPGFKQTKEDTEIKFWVEKVVLKQEMQLKEKKSKMTSEEGATQSSKTKKVPMEEEMGITLEKTEGSEPGTSCLNSETESKLREKSDLIKLTRSGSSGQEDSSVGKRPIAKRERSEEKVGGKEEPKWLCNYCKDFFETEDEVVTHSKNKHPENPVKAMLVPEETAEPTDDFWFIELVQGVDTDDDSGESDGTVKKKSRKNNSCYCGFCMVEVTDQSSVVHHFETFHRSIHISARMSTISAIYYRCNVCLEKLFTFSCLSVHGMERHPNMTLQFEIRKIYERDTKVKISDPMMVALDEAKDGSYQCPRCPAISSSYLDCIDHFNEHYPRYTCRSCNIRYYTVEEMEIHQDKTRHPKPYAMTIPSERMLDEYKAGIRIKKEGVWVPLQEQMKSEVTDGGPPVKRPKMATARKSITRIPERR